jgi:NAD dependent epimerase/dehydratase family enzyme
MLARVGLGGPQFGGKTRGARQRFSWVHLDDVVRAIDFIVEKPTLSGTVNLSSPNPVDNRELMATLRKVVGAKFGVPLVEWMLKLGAFVIGTETELLLKSRWVVPTRLLAAGYEFEFPLLEDALRDILRK